MKKFINSPQQKSTSQKLTNHAKKALLEADQLAKKFRHPHITDIHFLYAIFLETGSLGSNILKDIGIEEKNFTDILSQKISRDHGSSESDLRKIITKAYAAAKDFQYTYVGTEHLIFALIQSPSKEILQLLNESRLKSISQSINSLFSPDQFSNIPKFFEIPEVLIGKKLSKKSSSTPFIDKFCIDINAEVRNLDEPVIGRKEEISRMIHILGRKNKNNPLLIGDPGVGKTALVSGLAQMINSSSVPSSLYRKKIMGLDVAQLIAGTGFRGEFESRLKEITKEAAHHRNIILFIDEIHTIVGAGNIPGGLDLANIIKPALARGEVQIIGATTFEEYKKYIEKDMALERRFQPININEPTEAEAEKILLGIRKNYEKFHNVIIPDEAINSAIKLSVRYIPNRFLPDKAIDVIDETSSYLQARNIPSSSLKTISQLEDERLSLLGKKELLVSQEDYAQAILIREKEKTIDEKIQKIKKLHSSEKRSHPILMTPQDIMMTIAQTSKIPLEKIAQEKNARLKNIDKILSQKIVGQPEVVNKIAQVILRSQSGIADPRRPIGSFLFLGPTGVGKTLAANLLASEFFSGKHSLIRIDMSELMERHSVSSLIGSPAGYIGYGEGGRLTEKVRRNPHSVVLFDEIEKAHPDIFNILLQILEDGTLTDAEGTHVSFKNTIIILTSNIGTAEFAHHSDIGFESPKNKNDFQRKFNEKKDHSLQDLEKRIRPELLSRLDHILTFNSLSDKDILQITKNEIDSLIHRTREQKIKVTVDTKTIKHIAQKSLAFNQGARLVRKNIQELLENPIAEMIIYDKVKASQIRICFQNDKLKFI